VGVGLDVGVKVGVAVGVALGLTVGVGVDVGVGDVVAGSLSKKASCWDALLIVTRPSAQALRCCVRTAEP
jgi:hypothetical protein